jgi:hypothetical protein
MELLRNVSYIAVKLPEEGPKSQQHKGKVAQKHITKH